LSDCNEKDCFFYDTNDCTDCRECAYCGRHIDGRNRHMDHVLPQSSGGKTKVPTCRECNLSKGTKGLVTWLKWLHENDRERFYTIRDNNTWKSHKFAHLVQHTYSKNFHMQDLKKSLFG
jgi:5-methylcytosine-specific restriction endonuclease McrA